MSKHTSGKWEAVFGELSGMGEFSVYQGETGTICRGDSEMIQWKANAQLISAAPDMYEALKNIIERGIIVEADGDHYDETIDAIAKAEGR